MKTALLATLLALAAFPTWGQKPIPYEDDGNYQAAFYLDGAFAYPRDEVFFTLKYTAAKTACCIGAKVFYTNCSGEKKYVYAYPIDNREGIVQPGTHYVQMRFHFDFNVERGSDCVKSIETIQMLPLLDLK
jgi:hypothetical protein